jgi:hypothetical protein
MSYWIDETVYVRERFRRNMLMAYTVAICVGFMAGRRYGWFGVGEALVVGVGVVFIGLRDARVDR